MLPFGGQLNKMSNGGKLNAGMTGMMKARMALANEFGNNAARRMVSPNPKTGMTPEGIGTHYMSSVDNYAVPLLQDTGGSSLELMDNPKYNPKEDIRFDRPEDAQYFAEHYKEIAPMMKNNNFAYGGHSNGAEWDNDITVFDNGAILMSRILMGEYNIVLTLKVFQIQLKKVK